MAVTHQSPRRNSSASPAAPPPLVFAGEVQPRRDVQPRREPREPPALALVPRAVPPPTAPPWLRGTVLFVITALPVGAAFLGLGVLFGRSVLGG
jgi:hypothetical protein